ncbi:ankyrin repeat-containing domain protein [Pavlovales sp. CCMP2436]|nr:ankyrin repeat-containing domain protein [Pavlovales sp. CCMP2436]
MSSPSDLLDAAAAGDVVAVGAALDAGADPRCETSDGFSPLVRAAAGGHAAVVELLLAAGAPANSSRLGHSALRGASLYGHAAVVELLLAAKADPNFPSAGLRTPLMGAAFARTSEPGYSRAGVLAAAASLLRAGAAPNAQNDTGETALSLGAMRSDAEFVELLLANGADARIRALDNRCAADLCTGEPELAARLRAAMAAAADAAAEATVARGAGTRPPPGGSDVFLASEAGAIFARLYTPARFMTPRSNSSGFMTARSSQRATGTTDREYGLLVVALADRDFKMSTATGGEGAQPGRWSWAPMAMRAEEAVWALPSLDKQSSLDVEQMVAIVSGILAQLRELREVVLCGVGFGALVAAEVASREAYPVPFRLVLVQGEGGAAELGAALDRLRREQPPGTLLVCPAADEDELLERVTSRSGSTGLIGVPRAEEHDGRWMGLASLEVGVASCVLAQVGRFIEGGVAHRSGDM